MSTHDDTNSHASLDDAAAPEDSAGDDGGEFQERMLGEFRLLRRLGRGGMADVYLAEQTSLKRAVAVKVLRNDQLDRVGEQLLQRFQQEAKAAGGLNHPNIVQVYAVGQQDGLHYIVQEYVQGRTLRGFLAKKGPPEVPLALHIMRQVASALQAASEAGIVHRDVKPDNIMITRKGDVKVTDFGLALLIEAEERQDLTQHGTTLGTPSYMSPEQVSHAKVDHRSDIYSFGATCYHMLAGKPPFRGPTAMSVAVKHVKETPEPLAKLRPDLPPVLCEIVEKMMHKEVAERYQDAKSLLADLRSLSKALKQQPDAAAALHLSHISPSAGRRAKGRRNPARWFTARPAVAFVLSLVLVGSASAGVGWWLRPRNPFDTPPPNKSDVEVLGTAREQFLLATRLVNDEDAWKAVIENFDKREPEVRRAQEKLALLYLRTRRYDEAKALFQELSYLGSEYADLHAVGVAGLAVIACLQGDHAESQRLIEVPLRQAMERLPPPRQLDPVMENLIREAFARNQQQLGETARQDYERLFPPASADEGAPVVEE
jgi:serine/threonine-protein kinase